MPDSVVLDSSAILALLQNEVGSLIVGPIANGSLLSAVNLTEVYSRMIGKRLQPSSSWRRIEALQCELCPFSSEQARIASELVPITRPLGLSLGDRACLALALDRKATVYTADRAWKSLDVGIKIEVIR